MKKIRNGLLIALFILGLSKAIRTQTDGVCFAKTTRCMAEHPEWELPEVFFAPQRFYYLGSGVQCYAFLSADGHYVLKLFKHYHLWPSTPFLKQLPFTTSFVKAREQRMEEIFSSALLAMRSFPQETGLISLSINPPKKTLPCIEIYDKIGVRHLLNLNQTPFVLQKCAEPFFKALVHFSPSQIARAIPPLITILKAFENTDPFLSTNYGFYDEIPCAMDIGSLKKRAFPPTRRELYFLTLEFRRWLEQNAPELIQILNESIS